MRRARLAPLRAVSPRRRARLDTRVERAEYRAASRLPDDDEKDHDGEQNPELGFAQQAGHQLVRSDIARSTAAARLAASAAVPVTFSVTDRATSTAISRISSNARCFPSAMSRSAAATC